MEAPPVSPPRRRGLLAKFTGASLIGFVFSAATLHFGLQAGLPGWGARLIALLVAMHVTFFINGRFVFRALTRERFLGLWAAYVANSAVGNTCNFLIFMGLRSTHRPVISDPYVAFLGGAITAWAINFLGARFVVFGDLGRRLAARVRTAFSPPASPRDPAPAEPGSSRRSPPWW
jgi:putative flippase GtrA